MSKNNRIVLRGSIGNPEPGHKPQRGFFRMMGIGQLDVEDVRRILEARDLRFSAEPAPAHGLCLIKVTYPDEENV